MLCFDVPEVFIKNMTAASSGCGIALLHADPFAIHAFLIEQLAALYDAALWGSRDIVRALEKVMRGSFC